ncbi:unnamed protein product [Mytilus coruscus]|uniref:DDE Tnp4 domain-containing protein n=1 Tax=Mytilus coruscus TaxID=42192 RepID=A0A6J8BJ04_MYTCO|nr:unnamed protein product [Mytilus coruscus]
MQSSTIFNIVEFDLNKIARKATNMRSPIQPEERLAVTLRYLATGKFHHLHAHEWLTIAKDFNEKWNFPNCLGAVDGKHVVIQAPNNSGSYFYNYKNTHSVVLMAAVDASYRFIYVDALECNDLNIPEPTPLPSRNKPTPYVFVADEAFPLKENIMRPYPQRGGLDDSRRIFNYRLSRARRIVENAFGILCNRFRVMRAPILLSPEKVTHVVMACCALHNYLRPESFLGLQETENIEINNLMPPMARGGYHSSSKARDIREGYKEYFTNIGQVPWQHKVLS